VRDCAVEVAAEDAAREIARRPRALLDFRITVSFSPSGAPKNLMLVQTLSSVNIIPFRTS